MTTLSIDWEDFGQLLCRDKFDIITPPRDAIDRQTHLILDLLDKTEKKATFFILGMLSKFRSDLVKEIHKRGHEIGLHGTHHKAMSSLSRKEAKDDIATNIYSTEDIIGQKVYGYRAPYFSVNKKNIYVLEILAELGLTYDSSIFPMRMPRYGIDGFNPENKCYDLPNGLKIVELPITISNLGRRKIPVAGGGYMRILPYSMVKQIFKKINNNGEQAMIYMHPYEFDNKSIDCTSNYPDSENYSSIKKGLLNLKWNVFRRSIIKKIEYLLLNYDFITCIEKANNVKNTTHSTTILG